MKIPDAAIDAPPPQPDAPPPDASPYDFSCVGMPFPTTADPNVTISGTAQELQGMNIVAAAGVTIGTYKEGGGNSAVDTTTTATDGTFTTGSISTNGTPVELHLKATKESYRDTYVFPGSAVTANVSNVPVLTVTTDSFSQLTQLFSIIGATQSDGNAMLILLVTDCAGTPVTGVKPTVTQSDGSMVADGNVVDINMYAGGGFPGVFFVTDVIPGATIVNYTFGSNAYPARTIGAHASSDTLAQIIPGPQN